MEELSGSDARRQLASVAPGDLPALGSDDDHNLQGPVHFGEIVFQCSGIVAFSGGIVDVADERPAVLVRLITEDVFGELSDELLLA